MWLKIVCVVVIASGARAADELLQSLYGPEGRNRMSVCVPLPRGRWRRCDGALLRREWVVARAHCLAAAAPTVAVRTSAGGSCDHEPTRSNAYSYRNIRQHVMHPWFDLTLIIVDHPYNNLEKLDNSTDICIKLKPHGVSRWMKHYFKYYSLTRNQEHQIRRIAEAMKTGHYPIWLFLTTMVLPTMLFMLFFTYVTFYTGSSQEIPYKKLQYSKKVTNI